MSAFNRAVKLTVISDVICPNCNIGQHELISAISYCQDTLHLPLTFQVEFMPFRLIPTTILNEDMPKVSKVDFFTNCVGKDNFTAMEATISKWGQEKGIPISFNGVMCQSTRAHRLSRKAYKMGGQEKQLPLLCALFRVHLEEGKDISDIDILSDAAAEVGMMTKQEAIDFLKSNELEEEVDRLCREAKAKGVTGIPMTVIDGKWVLNGGQSSEVFVQIFKKLAYTSVSAAPSPFSAPVVEVAT